METTETTLNLNYLQNAHTFVVQYRGYVRFPHLDISIIGTGG